MKRGWLANAAIAAALCATLCAADSGYADPHACAACHAQIAESYARTGMGRSFYKPSAANTVEDYRKLSPANTVENYRLANSFYHAASDTHFTMIERSGRYYQRRYQIGRTARN